MFEITRDHHAHGVPVKADQLAQESNWQQVLAFLAFLIKDDLGQDRAGDILARLRILHDKFLTGLHHHREVLKRDIGT